MSSTDFPPRGTTDTGDGSHRLESLWDSEAVPSVDDEKFKALINDSSQDVEAPFTPPESHCKVPPFRDGDWPNSHITNISFGDDDLTATISKHGNLGCFQCYLGLGDTGLAMADHPKRRSPERARGRTADFETFEERVQEERELSIGLKFNQFTDVSNFSWVHYRWPRTELSNRPEDLTCTTQWVVNDGTLVQQLRISNTTSRDIEFPFTFSDQMLIRDCNDTVSDDVHPFNQGGKELENYEKALGPHGYSWVLAHKIPHNFPQCPDPQARMNEEIYEDRERFAWALNNREKEEPSSVAVVVSIRLNGKMLTWNRDEEGSPGTWTQKLRAKTTDNATSSLKSSMEIVVAYRFIKVYPHSNWESFIIPQKTMRVDDFLRAEVAKFTEFSLAVSAINMPRIWTAGDPPEERGGRSKVEGEDDEEVKDGDEASRIAGDRPSIESTSGLERTFKDMEFVLRKHLENVLSDCSICTGYVSYDSDEDDPRYPVIALTCGSQSLHRITPSTSFFCFAFLIECGRHLHHLARKQPLNTDGTKSAAALYIEVQLERIYTKCHAHIRWLLYQAEDTEDCGFAPSYWPSGRSTLRPESDRWEHNASWTDGAFQVIKFYEFQKLSSLMQRRLNWTPMWVRSKQWYLALHRANLRDAYVWARRERDGVPEYRLEDNGWIWRALRAFSAMTISYTPPNQPRDHDSYALNTVQLEMLRRFTTEHEVLGTHLMAVGRSPRESRFLFHSRDTALFYAADIGFFKVEALAETAWQNTVRAQSMHNPQSLANPEPFSYGILYLLATRGIPPNLQDTRGSEPDAQDLPSRILLEFYERNLRYCYTQDGRWRGYRTWAALHDEGWLREDTMDAAFHAQFEMPFILLTHLPDAFCTLRQGSVHERGKQKHTLFSAHDAPFPGLVSTKHLRRESRALKKTMPLNSRVDVSNIVEVEEEWLYRYPESLRGRRELLTQDINDICDRMVKDPSHEFRYFASPLARLSAVSIPTENMFGMTIYLLDHKILQRLENRGFANVVDVPRGKPQRARPDSPFILIGDKPQTFADLMFALNRPRTAKEAKKRLVWMPEATELMAVACWLTAPEVDKSDVSSFFSCHKLQFVIFREHSKLLTNTWTTVAHLSFYQLNDRRQKESREEGLIGLPVRSSADKAGRITKATLSFMFIGDFFDRSWTCYFTEFTACEGHVPAQFRPIYNGGSGWKQRKVLELCLFDRAIRDVIFSTRAVLNHLKQALGIKGGTLATFVLNSEDYFSSSARWQETEQTLQVVEEQLDEVFKVVTEWELREKNRGHERPRWSQNDERDYRGEITSWENAVSQSVRLFRSRYNSIRSLKEMLRVKQAQIRDDLSLRGSENIRLFTYVTIIFLPLGFAASIFSMSEPPSGLVIRSMATCAMVTLLVTTLLLLNAKSVLGMFETASFFFSRYSRRKMNSSSWASRQRSEQEVREEEIRESEMRHSQGATQDGQGDYDRQRRKHPQEDNSWHLGFWAMYLLLELPASAVLQAYLAFKAQVLSWKAFLQVIVGILVLPLFATSWVVQFVLVNIMDLAHQVRVALVRARAISRKAGHDNDERLERLTRLPDAGRLFKVESASDGDGDSTKS